MRGSTQPGQIFGLVLLGVGVTAAASICAAQTVFQPPPLSQFLEENGWVSLRVPDKRMGPGSVIKVIRKDGAVIMQWLGDLRRCGIPDKEIRFVRQKYPAIGIGKTFGVRASVVAGYIAKLGGAVDIEKAGGAILQIEDSGGDAVDFRALAMWLAEPDAPQRMPQTCNRILAQEDIYLVAEAFRISGASYDLVNTSGAKLAITGSAFGRAGDRTLGALSVKDDLYFGVRRVMKITPDLIVPSPGAQTIPEADSLLRLMEP